jgi:hypothetical protein
LPQDTRKRHRFTATVYKIQNTVPGGVRFSSQTPGVADCIVKD